MNFTNEAAFAKINSIMNIWLDTWNVCGRYSIGTGPFTKLKSQITAKFLIYETCTI